jgi:DNA gyrase/topoisomerase IV subunit B
VFFLPYDENLPKYYNQNHEFLWKRMDKMMLSKSKLFEKIQIDWFSEAQLKTKRSQFRGFYREIVDKFVDEIENIRLFVSKKSMRKTRKNRED